MKGTEACRAQSGLAAKDKVRCARLPQKCGLRVRSAWCMSMNERADHDM
eukprot:CAMPEP_0172325126 /NCGR_PEP_ID=MMETSP1058-20130122/53230_1 /TAXON_ID=83371 /ORGANISM="Detonula confervacea, Strain CCMP 353" /LENGTH=48 /DNA_ID= /DNA_START= /DNA_END= /DNA_ORIENTATION=